MLRSRLYLSLIYRYYGIQDQGRINVAVKVPDAANAAMRSRKIITALPSLRFKGSAPDQVILSITDRTGLPTSSGLARLGSGTIEPKAKYALDILGSLKH